MAAYPVAERSAATRFGRPQAGTLWILGRAGRAGKVQWRAERQDEAAAARALFNQLCRRGYRAFMVGAAQPRRSVTRFESAHAQLMLTPGPAAGWEDSDAAALSESMAQAHGLLRSLLRKPAPPPMCRQLRASREALAMLLRVLSPRQRQSLRETGGFTVVGGASGLRYRIRSSGQANIEQLDVRGVTQHRLRIAPACELALPGWLAMQALHLQDPETEYPFLAAAQVFPA